MAGMVFPNFFAGQEVDADLMTSSQTIWAVKPSATSRSSTTTLSADPDLTFDLPTAGTWIVEAWLNYTGGTLGSSDLKVRMNYSGTLAFNVFGVAGINTISTSQFTGAGGTATGPGLALGTSGGNFFTTDIKGTYVTTTTGTFDLEWAQNTSSATATTLRQGCWMRAFRIE